MQPKQKKEKRRPDKGMAPWQMVVFTAVLTLTGVCSLLMEKPTVSEMEQRQLAAMPQASWKSWFDGSFGKEYDAFYADTFPLRDFLVSFSSQVKENLGLRYDDVRILGGADAPVDSPDPTVSQPEDSNSGPQQDPASDQDPTVSQPEQSSSSSQQDQTDDIGVNKSGIFIYKGMGMSLFGGNESVGKVYADNINAYHEVFGDSVRVFDMVVPTSAEFYLPEKYQSLSR